jgi:hypothetical protein
MLNFSKNTSAFTKHIIRVLHGHDPVFSIGTTNSSSTSAVLFLLGPQYNEKAYSSDPCLILNKRSTKVKQPGDLCCPGGSVSTKLDFYLAKLLYLPGSPLTRWPYWSRWHKQRHQDAQSLALLFATSLRESFEEMRLNPLGLKFLGPLPSQQLVMFRRVIYPMVCWISFQKRFVPNREVEKVVYIPLQSLLNPLKYARYQLQIKKPNETDNNIEDFPCFLHEQHDESEVLWGATFRITMVFLDIVFGFRPPDIGSLPAVHGTLDENYLTGNG